MENLKKEIIDFISANPTADITVQAADDNNSGVTKSYGLICLTLFNLASNIPQQIIIGEYDSNITECININNNLDNINAAVDMYMELIGSKQVINVYMNE